MSRTLRRFAFPKTSPYRRHAFISCEANLLKKTERSGMNGPLPTYVFPCRSGTPFSRPVS